MTTLAAANAALDAAGGPRASADPFVVTGTFHGRAQSVTVPALPDVLAVIGHWAAQDPDATGSWALRTDYSAPVNLVARLRAGLVGERRRVAHVFSLVPGATQGCKLTTCCGEQLNILHLEWLSLGQGMPCEPCLRAATAHVPPEPAAPAAGPALLPSRPRALRPAPRLAY